MDGDRGLTTWARTSCFGSLPLQKESTMITKMPSSGFSTAAALCSLWIHLLLVGFCSATTQDELDTARDYWYFGRNGGYYDFHYTKSGVGDEDKDYPWLVEVRYGVVNRTTTANGTLLPSDATPPPIINDVFDTIQYAIDARAFDIQVTYNSTWGYPEEVYIDYDTVPGDEYVVSIANVEKQPTYNVSTEQARLHDARGLWNSAAIEVYTFRYYRLCFGCWLQNFPWNVRVSGGQVRAIDSAGALVNTSFFGGVQSVQDVFDSIQFSLDAKAFEVAVDYSAALGYPTRFYYNGYPIVVDEEYQVEISAMGIIGNPLAELAVARELWATTAVSSYSYRLNKPNEEGNDQMPYPWIIEVRDGLGVSIADANGVVYTDDIPLMESHFETIESALNDELEVQATYSRTFGFPIRIEIESVTKPNEVVEISNFRQIE